MREMDRGFVIGTKVGGCQGLFGPLGAKGRVQLQQLFEQGCEKIMLEMYKKGCLLAGEAAVVQLWTN